MSKGARGLWIACSGIALALVPTACRQIVGFADEPRLRSQPGEAAGGPASDAGIDGGVYVSTSGNWPFFDRVCGTCIDRNCADEANACALDPSCQAYEECKAACGDTQCASHCLSRVPSAVLSIETWPLNHCVASLCPAACPSSIVSLPGGQTCGPLVGNIDCSMCCCKEFDACDKDPVCVRQIACSRRCGLDPADQSCFEACTGRHPDPPSIHANLGACAETPRCGSSCGLVDWSCLGHVRWAAPSSGSWKLYGSVLDFDSLTSPTPVPPVVGFDVKACAPRDFLCMNPFDEMKTNQEGRVELDLSKNIFGTSAYFEVTAPIGLDYPTTLFFLPSWILTHSVRTGFIIYHPASNGNIPVSDPGRGGVLFFVHDCSQAGHRAAGVEVTANPPGSSPPAYVREGYAPDPSVTFTDSIGIGFITNLLPGQVKLSAVRHDTGEHIGTTPIVIQAGAMTIAELVPTP